MGKYLNPGNIGFQSALNSQIYVDKTGIIDKMNRVLGTKQRYICVSRARRFGKTMAEEMLAAYYDRSCDSREQFKGKVIEQSASFEKHLNQYDVIFIDMQGMRERTLNAVRHGEKISVVGYLQREVILELQETFPEAVKENEISLPGAMSDVFQKTGRQFIILIDEWDCVFRSDKENGELQEEYLGFLRSMFKDVQSERFILLAYMTGILPIKKYGTQSALNNFYEYTMVKPGFFAEYVGFTEKEVQDLCEEYQVSFEEMKRWYDGYYFEGVGHVYNPKAVVEAILSEEFENYWTATETYESLRFYIEMNFEGLKDDIIWMLGGNRCRVTVRSFQNDMVSVKNKDDVLTLLIHLGYLAYDRENEEAFIPNQEVADEFRIAVDDDYWSEIMGALKKSEQLLKDTWSGNEEEVAAQIDGVHMDTASILNYNDENALSCVISLAYYSARKYYTLVREMPAGKGFADLVFFPRRKYGKNAMVVELKGDKSAQGAIRQIKEKNYVKALEGYEGEVFLVGINYDKKEKKHSCVIEKGVAER